MKTLFSLVAICALSACAGGGSSGSDAVPVTTQLSGGSAFAGKLNEVRAANGAAPLTYDARLARAAQKHANDMLAMARMTHTGSDGSSAGERIDNEGYNWRTFGENVAQGQRTADEVLNGWVGSPGHQRNNVNPKFENFALASAGTGNQTYWALVFATEQ